MPLYRCHKEVWALRLSGVGPLIYEDGSAFLYPFDEAPFKVSAEYMEKHKPHAGGFYVVYKDGYESFSPAEAFEDGYTLVTP